MNSKHIIPGSTLKGMEMWLCIGLMEKVLNAGAEGKEKIRTHDFQTRCAKSYYGCFGSRVQAIFHNETLMSLKFFSLHQMELHHSKITVATLYLPYDYGRVPGSPLQKLYATNSNWSFAICATSRSGLNNLSLNRFRNWC